MSAPVALSEEEVLEIVAKALTRVGKVFSSKHFKDSMNNRNFRITDARKVLGECTTIKPVLNTNEKSHGYKNWNYDFTGKDTDGNDLVIRIAVTDDKEGIVLVTGFGS